MSALYRALTGALLTVASLHAAAQSTSANIEAGQRIATSGNQQGAPACASCHGAQGEGNGTYPPLSGQVSGYLQRQLETFANRQRKHSQMSGIAKALTAQEQADVAAYYASLKLPLKVVQGPLPTAKDSQGAWLAERGRWEEGIPACSKCHGPAGAGVGKDFPAIAHLSAQYMNDQIKAWNTGNREAGPLGLMGSVAKKLTPQDIEDVAAYYRSLQQAQ